MSVIAPCKSNPKNTVASSSPGFKIVHLNHCGIRGVTDRLRSEPPAGWAGRAVGACAAKRAPDRKGWGTDCSRNDSWGGGASATMAGLPEHQAEQGFHVHALEGVEPAAPAVEQAAVPDQAEGKHREGGKHGVAPEAICGTQLAWRSVEQLVHLQLEVAVLGPEPAV